MGGSIPSHPHPHSCPKAPRPGRLYHWHVCPAVGWLAGEDMHRAMGQHRQRKEKQGWSLQPRETDHRDQGTPGRVGQMLSSESTKHCFVEKKYGC